MTNYEHRTIGAEVIRKEARQLELTANMLVGCEDFNHAVEQIACNNSHRPTVITGMGKSGIIAQKFAASLRSIGQSAIYMHPSDAYHGDLGLLVGWSGVVVMISHSGTTEELVSMVPILRHGKMIETIAIVKDRNTPLGQLCEYVIPTHCDEEADKDNLLPTCSTTAALAVCDALLIAIAKRHLGFGSSLKERFARAHPKGALGDRLNIQVNRLPLQMPYVHEKATLDKALEQMEKHNIGIVGVVSTYERKLLGVITDGDIRRMLHKHANDWVYTVESLNLPVTEVMNPKPVTFSITGLASDAATLMESHKPRPLNVLAITDYQNKLEGFLHIHQLAQIGLMTQPSVSDDENSETESELVV